MIRYLDQLQQRLRQAVEESETVRGHLALLTRLYPAEKLMQIA